MKVENMISNRGNTVANQFIIHVENGNLFQSYYSIIAFITFDGQVFLNEDKWDYSRTTGKYRNNFLGEEKKETEQKIKDGRYKLISEEEIEAIC